MAALLAVSFVTFALLGRVALQYFLTGNHGIRLADPIKSPVAAIAGAVFSFSFIGSLCVVGLDYFDVWTVPPLDVAYLREIAILIGLSGVGLVVTAQFQMGNSWRIGVDPSESTRLVRRGLYRNSRNPIYFGIGLYWLGLAALLPHPTIWVFAILCWLSIEVIVRRVEEPYLREKHGSTFEAYLDSTNRYLVL